jgi:hypothetical protein
MSDRKVKIMAIPDFIDNLVLKESEVVLIDDQLVKSDQIK